MPVVSRIDWILRQLASGRRGRLSIGAAHDRHKVKLHVTLEPPGNGAIDPIICTTLTATLREIRALAISEVAVDRGHRYSDGTSVIAIWMHRPSDNNLLSSRSPPPPAAQEVDESPSHLSAPCAPSVPVPDESVSLDIAPASCVVATSARSEAFSLRVFPSSMGSDSVALSAGHPGAGSGVALSAAAPATFPLATPVRHHFRPDDRIMLVMPHSSSSVKRGDVTYPIGTVGTIVEEDADNGGRTRRWWVAMDGSDREISISKQKMVAISR
eukprot:gnl/TRDRNA2_/TRDRNA2_38496_c0_seq1.p1 gnl/TRDRNA2_/TRDRNA2_38496_c0~~gnl/TRDRNA2_/TRDRNA2_38496_c0_seq1.p1  ORF type:complete len:270 (-),score=5.56 gnl/TRDRNA2_/TRDRNA2_38496_c0_seq1:244-1053(-)